MSSLYRDRLYPSTDTGLPFSSRRMSSSRTNLTSPTIYDRRFSVFDASSDPYRSRNYSRDYLTTTRDRSKDYSKDYSSARIPSSDYSSRNYPHMSNSVTTSPSSRPGTATGYRNSSSRFLADGSSDRSQGTTPHRYHYHGTGPAATLFGDSSVTDPMIRSSSYYTREPNDYRRMTSSSAYSKAGNGSGISPSKYYGGSSYNLSNSPNATTATAVKHEPSSYRNYRYTDKYKLPENERDNNSKYLGSSGNPNSGSYTSTRPRSSMEHYKRNGVPEGDSSFGTSKDESSGTLSNRELVDSIRKMYPRDSFSVERTLQQQPSEASGGRNRSQRKSVTHDDKYAALRQRFLATTDLGAPSPSPSTNRDADASTLKIQDSTVAKSTGPTASTRGSDLMKRLEGAKSAEDGPVRSSDRPRSTEPSTNSAGRSRSPRISSPKFLEFDIKVNVNGTNTADSRSAAPSPTVSDRVARPKTTVRLTDESCISMNRDNQLTPLKSLIPQLSVTAPVGEERVLLGRNKSPTPDRRFGGNGELKGTSKITNGDIGVKYVDKLQLCNGTLPTKRLDVELTTAPISKLDISSSPHRRRRTFSTGPQEGDNVTEKKLSSAVAAATLSETSDLTTTTGLRGLANLGNTCFMNSIIQVLSNTEPLLDYIRQGAYLKDANTSSPLKGELIKEFGQIITEMWGTNSAGNRFSIRPVNLKKKVESYAPSFSGYNEFIAQLFPTSIMLPFDIASQQDSQEFLAYLLNGFHDDLNQAVQKSSVQNKRMSIESSSELSADVSWKRYQETNKSKIVDIFGGQLESILKCDICGNKSLAYDPFWSLSVSVSSDLSMPNIYDCLNNLFKEERLEGENQPFCSKCSKPQPSTKCFKIQRFPTILIIHLKRFAAQSRGSYESYIKIRTAVEFPFQGLDMRQYSHETTARSKQRDSDIYDLYAMTCHTGSISSGHYFSYCKHPFTQEWHLFEDSKVEKTSQTSMDTNNAYLLFYQKRH